MGVRATCGGGGLSLLLCAGLSAQSQQQAVVYLAHEHARPVFDALGERLPPASAWRDWIATSDRETRARVAQGDETSVVNLLLFGTSFTNEPRITSDQLDAKQIDRAVAARVRDFERALSAPGSNERLAFARRVLGGGSSVRARLLSMLERVIRENERHERLIRDAQELGDPSLQFAERSRLYRARGLSSDTSLRANFAVEEALRGLTPVLYGGQTPVPVRGSDPKIRRVAIIGPGLDFADKQEGYDFYPQQTVQPFAVIDSLLRLGFVRADELSVTTLDLSARVNDHLDRAVRRAGMGSPYAIHLAVLAQVSWTPKFLSYWQAFGDAIGGETASPPLPGAVGKVKIRSVDVRSSIVERITARDVNITAQHLALAGSERFDLIIATNMFVYYDRLQQGLAMISIAHMLKPGGMLLSNNALIEVPSTGLRSIGYSKTLYSDRQEDGDVIVWYQRSFQ